MHDQSKEDRKHRERLERQSISEGRADLVGSLNKLASGDILQRAASDVLSGLRAAAQGRARTVGDLNARHDAFLAKAANEALSRTHPLDRAAADFTPQPKQDTSEEGGDPAKDERYVSPLRAAKVPGAEGGVKGGARGYEPKGDGPKPIEPEFLTVEQMRVIAGVKALASRYF